MLPATRLAFTTAGRAGSLNWTETRSPLCASAGVATARAQPTNKGNKFCNDNFVLVMTFKYSNISIKVFYSDLRAAVADTPSCVTIRPYDQLAVAALFFDRLLWQRCEKEVAVNAAVECLETKIGGEIAREVKLNVTVQRGILGIRVRIFAEGDLHAAIDGPYVTRSPDVEHLDAAVHIAHRVFAGDVLDFYVALVHGLQLQ